VVFREECRMYKNYVMLSLFCLESFVIITRHSIGKYIFVEITLVLTYLCGTKTNIWLRPVVEDFSMNAGLEHLDFGLP
jgi:hypothetical protein